MTAPTAPLTASLQFAQSHVITAEGTSWTLRNGTTNLHLVGAKSALAIVRFGAQAVTEPTIEAVRNNTSIGTLRLAPPSSLPTTAGNGAPFATDAWTVDLPAAWIAPGTGFRIAARNYSPSQPIAPLVGADGALTVRVLPFYLFGATPANSQPLSATQAPRPEVRRELLAKWPVASLNVANHGAGYASWDRVIIGPNGSRPAYVVTKTSELKDGFDVMRSLLGILSRLREANGEGPTNTQYYGSILQINDAGQFQGPGGGLATDGAGVGDHTYSGIFFHEQGHAFRFGHAGEMFDVGEYPYPGGSLKGSAWAYDLGNRQFLSPLLAAGRACGNRQAADAGRCYKQDPMQGGAGDQDAPYRFAEMSDFTVARLQLWIEGRVFVETNGFSRWDSVAKARVPLPADNTQDNGQYGVNRNLPSLRDVAVTAIAIAFSRAGTPGASHIYPALRFTGNLIKTFDPTSAEDRAAITPGTGRYRAYCIDSGCDYTVRVTYDDGSVVHQLIPAGFRAFNKPSEPDLTSATDPNSGSSFRHWVLNVPGTRAIRRIELLETPMVWKGMPASPRVVIAR